MTASTVTEVLKQRLIRGNTVIVADSHKDIKLRGKTLTITSRGPVPCNGKGRCAGAWCPGLAVFVASAKTAAKDRKMGWRNGAHKICLTHLKDTDGELIVPPSSVRIEPEFESSMVALAESSGTTSKTDSDEVTWAHLAEAHRSGNLDKVASLARKLKSQNETLKSKVIEAQEKLIEHLT